MKVGIVGAGLIGKKRAQALKESFDVLQCVAEIHEERLHAFSKEFCCRGYLSWQDMLEKENVDVWIVATPNKFLAPVVVAAAEKRIHVLCEKPLGRNPDESLRMVNACREAGVRLKTGFNHRHHPAIWKAHELFDAGEIGKLHFLRARYGHGGRPGYDKEWRGNADLAGGGELLDQGVHIVDLFRWFAGDFTEGFGYLGRYVWDIAPLEDNGFALFKTASGIIAEMHTSWTNWKNIFSFEVFGDRGYLSIDGLGGSYGKETLTFGKRKPESGPPVLETFEFEGPDRSWIEEWQEFRRAIEENREPLASGHDGYKAVQMVHAVYEADRTGCSVKIE